MKRLLKTLSSVVLTASILLATISCSTTSDQTSNQTPTCSHQWTSATCTTPQTCSKCNSTNGKALGHNGKWSEWDIDYYDAVNSRELICTKCEEVVETQESPVTSFVNGRNFIIYPYAFAKRFEESSSRLNDIDYCTESHYTYGSFILDKENYVYYRIQDVNYNYIDIGMMSFTASNGKTISAINEWSENSFDCINILIEYSSDVSAVVYSTILAIDPNIGYSEAADVGQEVVDNIAIVTSDINEEDFQGINYNGINYLLYRNGKYHYLVISVI